MKSITSTPETRNIEDIIKQYKEYQVLKLQLEKQLDELKTQAIEYLIANETNEVLTNAGKVTYKEVVTNRFNSDAFKKDFADIYEEYKRPSSSMRFSCN